MGPLRLVSGAGPTVPALAGTAADRPRGFAALLDRLLSGANALHAAADKATEDLAAGRTDNLHSVMLAVAQADLAFRTVLEVRNKLLEAYQEVTRMQV